MAPTETHPHISIVRKLQCLHRRLELLRPATSSQIRLAFEFLTSLTNKRNPMISQSISSINQIDFRGEFHMKQFKVWIVYQGFLDPIILPYLHPSATIINKKRKPLNSSIKHTIKGFSISIIFLPSLCHPSRDQHSNSLQAKSSVNSEFIHSIKHQMRSNF